MDGGATFAEVLEARVGAWEAGDAPARTIPPRRTAPPDPLLSVEPHVRFWATPYATMAGDRVAPAAAAPPRRRCRRLTAPEQRALDGLVRLGATLGPDFTAADLRTAFRTLARRYHPDSHPTSDTAEHTRLARVFADVSEHHRRLRSVVAGSSSPH